MGYLIPLLRRGGVERALAFLAIGHIAQVVGSEMKTFLEGIMANVKEALQQRGCGLSLFSLFSSLTDLITFLHLPSHPYSSGSSFYNSPLTH